MRILSRTTNHFGKDSQPKMSFINPSVRTWCESISGPPWRNLHDLTPVLWVLHTVHQVFWNNLYEVWWVLDPGNIFLVDLYHETLGPGVSMGSYPFPFGIDFFSIHVKTNFASPWRPSFDSRCEPCIVPKNIVNVFCLPTKILWETQLFFRPFKTVISSTNFGSHCLSRKCRTHTFNNFSLAKW